MPESMPREFSFLTDIFHTIEISDPALENEHLRCVTVKSAALGGRGDVTLWVPPSQEIKLLLILLHGVYNSHWAWSLKAGVHRVAQALLDAGEITPMVIAMPSDGLGRDGSAYLTFPGAQDVEKWIVEEVPAIAHLAAPNLTANAKVSIGGFSMGGYGALRLGAKFPAPLSSHIRPLRHHRHPRDGEVCCGTVERLPRLRSGRRAERAVLDAEAPRLPASAEVRLRHRRSSHRGQSLATWCARSGEHPTHLSGVCRRS